ncbi:MAG TPA: hypothetical protein VF957_20715 [Bradyrhizobium sp.]
MAQIVTSLNGGDRALSARHKIGFANGGQISDGTLRNWRSMRVGPSFLKSGKAVLYPLEELDLVGSPGPRRPPAPQPLPMEQVSE